MPRRAARPLPQKPLALWLSEGLGPTPGCRRQEQRERVPADVALARVMAAASEPDFADRHVQLGRFYAAANTDDPIDKMEAHIVRLQEKLAAASAVFSFAPQNVRG